MDKYGEYGIALTKEWGLTNKIQPIQYINENSFCIRAYKNYMKIDMTLTINLIIKIYSIIF